MDRAELARVNRFAAVESLIVLVSHAAVKRLKMIVQRRQRHRHHACGRSAPCSQLTLRTLLARSLSPTAQQSRSQAVSIPRIFFWGGGKSPRKKNLQFRPLPQTAAKLCSESFSRLEQWITSISRKLSFDGQQKQKIIRHSTIRKSANLCLKCTKIPLAAWLYRD